jgi:lipopolysaccharide export LptBFGC system permease protein LptF
VFKDRHFDFPEQPEDFFVPAYRSMELSLVELYKETQDTRSEDERVKAWAEFYGRISYTLLGLPLLLLGLPLLLLVYRKWGRDLSLAIPVSCGMAFACWGVYTTLQSLAKAGYFPPWRLPCPCTWWSAASVFSCWFARTLMPRRIGIVGVPPLAVIEESTAGAMSSSISTNRRSGPP